MDDFLSKPVSRDSLRGRLQRWLGPSPADAPGAAAALDRPMLDELRALMGAGFGEFLAVFAEDNAPRLAAMRAAAAAGDSAHLAPLVHLLKGSAANVAAMPLVALCAELEARAPQAAPAELDARLHAIEAEYRRVAASLAEVARAPVD
jgi:HPt (histidine-containing phosphotransfer) domain-containing protein